MPVIYWTGQAVSFLSILVREAQILACSLDVVMAKEILKGEHIAAISQIFNGKSVAEAVKTAIGDVCPLSQPSDHSPQGVLGQPFAVGLGKHEIIGLQIAA